MIASIIALITSIFQSIPLFQKWFPPATAESNTESDEAAIAKEVSDIETTGRP